MGWHDDGVKLGLWGQDGIPYGINSPSWSSDNSSRSSYKKSNSSYSSERPLRYGFKKVNKSGAYKGAYYIRDGKKWIFDINALKYQLGISDDDELEELGYDVDAYYRYN